MIGCGIAAKMLSHSASDQARLDGPEGNPKACRM